MKEPCDSDHTNNQKRKHSLWNW